MGECLLLIPLAVLNDFSDFLFRAGSSSSVGLLPFRLFRLFGHPCILSHRFVLTHYYSHVFPFRMRRFSGLVLNP